MIERLLNFETLEKIVMKQDDGNYIIFGFNPKKINYFMIREKEINGTMYVLCPVPALFDEENSIEIGFALDVDEDHFFIYAYEHNYNTGKTLVLSKLPHCVHKAISYDINDPRLWDESGINMENIASATLFINNYLIDQIESLNNSRLKLNPSIELFDNKLYQQLIYRLAKTHNNTKVIDLRLRFLLKNFEVLEQLELDKDDPVYEVTYKRAINQLINFLFGCEDFLKNDGFLPDLTQEQLKLLELKSDLVRSICFYFIKEEKDSQISYFVEFCKKVKPKFNKEEILKIYKDLLNSLRVKMIKELYSVTKIKPDFNDCLDKLENAYRRLIINKRELSKAKWLYQLTKIPLPHDLLQQVYSNLIMQSKLENVSKIIKWSHIPISEQTIQRLYLRLFSLGRLMVARELCDTFKVEPKFDEEEMKSVYTKMLSRGYINAIKELYEWSHIEPKVDNEVLQDRYLYALEMNNITNAYNLYQFFHVRPEFDNEFIQEKYRKLINKGDIKLAQKFYELCGVPPDYTHNKINQYYKSLLLKNVRYAKKLYKWTKIMPDESAVQSVYKRLLKQKNIRRIYEIYKWTQIKVDITDSEAQNIYLSYLKERDINSFKEAYDFFKIPLSEKSAQKMYNYYWREDNYMKIIELERICKIKPNLPDQIDLSSYNF
ncbi:MAG: hypothetical protein ACTSU2_03725 [Promethearchaeota archaeon]